MDGWMSQLQKLHPAPARSLEIKLAKYNSGERTSKYTSPALAYLELRNAQIIKIKHQKTKTRFMS